MFFPKNQQVAEKYFQSPPPTLSVKKIIKVFDAKSLTIRIILPELATDQDCSTDISSLCGVSENFKSAVKSLIRGYCPALAISSLPSKAYAT